MAHVTTRSLYTLAEGVCNVWAYDMREELTPKAASDLIVDALLEMLTDAGVVERTQTTIRTPRTETTDDR